MTTVDRVRDPERLEALRSTGLLEVHRVPLLDQVTRMAVRLLHVQAALVTLIAEDRQVILSYTGTGGLPPSRDVPLSQSMCRHLLVDDAPMAVDDARRDERWRDIGAVARGELAAYAGTPLHAPCGQPLGALCVIDGRPRAWDREELETLGSLAVMAEAEISSRSAERARQELQEERTFLSALLDSLDVPVSACDTEGRIIRFNQPMREALQGPETPVHSSHWARAYQLFDADGRHLLQEEELPLVRALRERFTGQEVVVRRPGRPARRYLVNGHPLDSPTGRRLGAVNVGHDITARHRLQVLRDTQHAVTRALADAGSVEQAACGVIGAIAGTLGWACGEYWQVDPGGERVSRTGSWVRPGRDLSAFTGRDAMTVRSGQGLPGRVVATGRPVWIRDLNAEPDRLVRDGEALEAGLRTAVGLPVRSGERVLAVLTFFTDTAEERDDDLLDLLGGVCAHVGRFMERRRAEDLALALTASRRRFDRVVAQLDDLVWSAEIEQDGAARWIYQGGSTTGILGGHVPLGIDAAAFIGERVHPDDRQAFDGLLAGVRAGRPVQAEYRLTGLDGVTRWIWTRAAPRREDGRLLADGISTDVTERHRIAAERERLLTAEREQVRRLRELDRMKDELVALVSHEIRAPVAVIRSYAEMLADLPELTDEPRMFADVIDRRSAHLQHLVDDLLDLARLDAGHTTVDPRPVSLTRLVRQAVDEHRAAAAAKHLTVEVALEHHLPVRADPVRLRQVLDNLLSNAVKYTPEHGTVTVTAGCDAAPAPDGPRHGAPGHNGRRSRKHGGGEASPQEAETCRSGTVTVTVADTGIGVPAEEYPCLFDRFFRASTARRAGITGTGLGLAVTKAVVEAHGGTVTAAPGEGGGTVFTVRLPTAGPASRDRLGSTPVRSDQA
ncbi:multi-sensor signal transduction histidine kinase [Planomonospora sphaerica]|uniref:histidine kinase n=1 Tax=Planomonospora sphaerica TaxID=161355 RepID=A0A171B3N5_9ACTN|nr:ATP-binding protein [Planomonospora sphaerica]GAT64628.1 multi-sensor signal transduction histidine kinase [Planomonospora sphaerica]